VSDLSFLDSLSYAPTQEEKLLAMIEESLSAAAGDINDDADDEARPLIIEREPEISLADYMQKAWNIVDPGHPLEWNWHLDHMCGVLTDVSLGRRKRVVINVPPGMTKSMTICVMWPTWEWTWLPQSRWLFYSYNEKFAIRDSVRARRIIQSRWYQKRWGHLVRMTSDQNEKMRYENAATGFRMVSGFSGSVTGERGDRVVIDDPIKASEARNDNALEEVNTTFDEAISQRLNKPAQSAIVIIMQRVAAKDLAGHVLARGGWDHLSLPMEYAPRPAEKADTVPAELRNWSSDDIAKNYPDPRKKINELLHPSRFPRETVQDMKKILGSYATAAQFQQSPIPAGGGIFKLDWFKFWEPQNMNLGPVRLLRNDGSVHVVLPQKIPAAFTGVLLSNDLTFTGSTSYAVSDAYAWIGRHKVFLLDEERTNGEFPAQTAQIRRMSRRHPNATLKLVEAKANGQAAIATLRQSIPGLVPIPVTEGSKPERYDAVSPIVESGVVYLPHPDIPGYNWVYDWLIEVCSAPFGTYDDRADTLYMALARIFLITAGRGHEQGGRTGSRIQMTMGA
jgi:predicted phage terminase large subunit-like protein